MKLHEERLALELTDLDNKIAKLRAFLDAPVLPTDAVVLSDNEVSLLKTQLEEMHAYSTTLHARLVSCNGHKLTKVSPQSIEALVGSLTYKFERVGDTTVTGCWAFLPSGFQVAYGESACVDPANYDQALGEKYAKERCVAAAGDKLWELEGYVLSKALA